MHLTLIQTKIENCVHSIVKFKILLIPYLQCLSVPHLDRVVPEPAHDLAVVVLEAVHAFAILASAVDALQVVLPTPPVVLDGVNVLDDAGIQSPIEGVGWVSLPRFRLEQVLNPPSPVREPLPQTVGVDLPLYQLLPEHPLGNDPGPLPGDRAGVTQRSGVKEREDVLRNVIQTLIQKPKLRNVTY